MQICLAFAILILLPIQRVAPLPRVWFYLAMFYMLFAGTGLAWLLQILLDRIGLVQVNEKVISGVIMLALMITLINKSVSIGQTSAAMDADDSPEQFAAEYLASHLKPEDTIISTSPVDIPTAYYLYMKGIPYDVFHKRGQPVRTQNALIVLRTNSKYDTPESVLRFYNLTSHFDLQTAELVYNYGPLNIFSIASK